MNRPYCFVKSWWFESWPLLVSISHELIMNILRLQAIAIVLFVGSIFAGESGVTYTVQALS